MAMYGGTLRAGYAVLPDASDPTRALKLAGQAEKLELDYVGVQAVNNRATQLEPWTLLTAIGMSTSRIGLFAHPADLPFRAPDVLARAAASLALLTNGRFELGLAAATFGDQSQGDQSKEPAGEHAPSSALEEAIAVMRLLWSGERTVRYAGRYYTLDEMAAGPFPSRRIRIWLGGSDAQTVNLAGRLAEGWLPDAYPTLQPGDLARLSKQVSDVMASAGRAPHTVQRVWHISGTIGENESETAFQGSAQQWAAAIAELAVEAGIDTIMLMQREGDDAEEQLRRFAEEVIPRARELAGQAAGVPITGLERAQMGAGASGPTEAEEQTDDLDWVDETSMESFPASDAPASSQFT